MQRTVEAIADNRHKRAKRRGGDWSNAASGSWYRWGLQCNARASSDDLLVSHCALVAQLGKVSARLAASILLDGHCIGSALIERCICSNQTGSDTVVEAVGSPT